MAKEAHIKTDKNPLSAGVLGSYNFFIKAAIIGVGNRLTKGLLNRQKQHL